MKLQRKRLLMSPFLILHSSLFHLLIIDIDLGLGLSYRGWEIYRPAWLLSLNNRRNTRLNTHLYRFLTDWQLVRILAEVEVEATDFSVQPREARPQLPKVSFLTFLLWYKVCLGLKNGGEWSWQVLPIEGEKSYLYKDTKPVFLFLRKKR